MKIEERLMIKVIRSKKRLKGHLTSQQGKEFSILGIQFYCGIKEWKSQQSTVNLTACGWVHLSLGMK